MSHFSHLANLGKIALKLSSHDVRNWGDCSINHPIVVTLIDKQRFANEFLAALAKLSEEDAAGIVAQLE